MNKKLLTLLLSIGLGACGGSDSDKDDSQGKDNVYINEDYLDGGTNIVKIDSGYSEILDDEGSAIYESVAITPEMNFDKSRSLKAFSETLYPHLISRPNTSPSGAPKPLYASDNITLAHEYALTQVYFNDTQNSKLVTDLSIYRKNCVGICSNDAQLMLAKINEWKDRIQNMLPETPRALGASAYLTDEKIEGWIVEDKKNIAEIEHEYMVYTSLNKLHNSGATADELNIARAGLSKALNSVARWAPEIINPIDVNGYGMLYRFDIRDYWGWNKGVTKLLFGGSDDDIAFGSNKKNYLGNEVDTSTQNDLHDFTDSITEDPNLAKLIWQRILHGSVEEAFLNGNAPANIAGFHGPRRNNIAGEYILASELKWVEASQLVYTLTRPAVYNSIMMIPMKAEQLEEELGVDKSQGMDSYNYFVDFDAVPIDAEFSWTAKRTIGGFYLKSFSIDTGQLEGGDRSILDVYKEAGTDIRFPFWANPIPTFIAPSSTDTTVNPEDNTWSFIATLAQPFNSEPKGCDAQESFTGITAFKRCRHYTGTGGQQQSHARTIWDLPNGLNGYMISGAYNQRRVEAFINSLRDPRQYPDAEDEIITQTGFEFQIKGGQRANANGPRFTIGSMISFNPDGLNLIDNNLRDWLDNDQERLPKGPYGVDAWITDNATVARVKELYPTTEDSKPFFDSNRKIFLSSMSKINQEMVIGVDKNVYLEPITWLVEYKEKQLLENDDTPIEEDPVGEDPVIDPVEDPVVDPVVDENAEIFTPSIDPNVNSHAVLADGELAKPIDGFTAISDGSGGVIYEAVAITPEMNFDKKRSLEAFKETLYPYLRDLPNVSPSGAEKPLYASSNVELAHEYALTQIYFNDPENSKLVTDLSIYKRNCVNVCGDDASTMLSKIIEWKLKIEDMITETPRFLPTSVEVTEADIESWIATDKKTLSADLLPFVVYTSLHVLHTEGASADELNIARVGLSKALNSTARWAPKVVNPVDVTDRGILYRFDIRDYWGWNKGITKLLFGGSDDDIAFGQNKRDYTGKTVGSSNQNETYDYSDVISKDDNFAKLIWQRVLHGNVEGAKQSGNLQPNIDGFKGKRSTNSAGEYIDIKDFEWVEATQLIYTLTRPDVYASIMMIPMYADQLEDELGVDKSKGMDSYDYFVTFDAPNIDNQFAFKANRKHGGFYWRTFEVFTGQLDGSDRNIYDVYKEGGDDIRFPFWANPIPAFVDPEISSSSSDSNFIQNWSFVATLAQTFGDIPAGCDPLDSFSGINIIQNCKHYTGTGGLQQAGSTIIWDLPNGLNGYMRAGAYNQRRLDVFVNIIRDPRLIPDASDNFMTVTGFEYTKKNGAKGNAGDPRFNTSSSFMGLYSDGLRRTPNDLRDWLDSDQARLPKGNYGVDSWISDDATVSRVKELYPTTAESKGDIELRRKIFLNYMAKIKQDMVISYDKNVYVEPINWAVEEARKMHGYPATTSN